MTTLELLSYLRKLELPFIQTGDVADLLQISIESASKHLDHLYRKGFIEKVCRGKWVLRESSNDPLQVAEFITAPKESYISLQSALFYHGIIEQIPTQIYSVTIDRSRIVKTPMGIFSFHHCDPSFFTGYEYIKPYLKLASSEKALVDYFYFAPSKNRQFKKLPEVTFSKKFSWRKAFGYCDLIGSKRTRSLVDKKIRELFEKSKGV